MDLGKISLLMTMIDLVDKISSNIDNKDHNIGIYFVFISERLLTQQIITSYYKTAVLWYKRHSL